MNDSILRGFLLLQPSSTPPYRGVDRQPFAPSLAAEELDPTMQPSTPGAPVWTFCRPGWRRETYRIYEENAVQGWGSLSLIATYQTAQRIEQLIEPHIGPHEIVVCQVLELGATPFREGPPEWNGLGIDVAYPGGDFYSAVLNGLLENPHPALALRYRNYLNQYGLLDEMSVAREYLSAFRELVSSEATAEFCAFFLGAKI